MTTAGPERTLVPLGTAALPRVLARGAAGAGAGCAALHAAVVPLGPAGWPAVGTLALSLACLSCAVHLWRRPEPAPWVLHALLAAAMLAVHPPLAATGQHHGATGLAAWGPLLAGLLAAVVLALAVVRTVLRPPAR
jgi:hypothetical protein